MTSAKSERQRAPFTGSLKCSTVRQADRREAKHAVKTEDPHIMPITIIYPSCFLLFLFPKWKYLNGQ